MRAISRETRVALALLALLLVLNVALNPLRFAPAAWGTLLGLAAPLICAALASMPAILGGRGGIDVSVGPAMGFINAVLIKTLVIDCGITTAWVLVPAAICMGRPSAR
jgi:ribose transport system permease protein